MFLSTYSINPRQPETSRGVRSKRSGEWKGREERRRGVERVKSLLLQNLEHSGREASMYEKPAMVMYGTFAVETKTLV
jgi:hypothetical protein